ncbi:hypothetical protein SEA_SAINTS25_78 [Mycobacterium phage Saints25]|nr:hypothetical protein SEA_SAINTS25_78 [Mycobacterium phage Saints25]WNO28523.1 hypothetical protein SEA_HIGHBURY_78 [Mycobacterium phage Highbury]
MSDVQVSRNFHKHPKVVASSNGALGLWIKALSWSRAHRKKGHVPAADAELMGTPEEIRELVDNRLWDVVEGGYRYHDYGDWYWNPRTTAENLVYHVVGDAHPDRVLRQLEQQIESLLTEGTEIAVAERALKLWLAKPNAGAALLPYLVSDALRATGNAAIEEALRDAYRTGDMAPLLEHGYIYELPDPEPGMTIEQVRAATLAHKREQIKKWQQEL